MSESSKSKVTLEKIKYHSDLRMIRIVGPEGEEKLLIDLDELNQLKQILKVDNCNACKK